MAEQRTNAEREANGPRSSTQSTPPPVGPRPGGPPGMMGMGKPKNTRGTVRRLWGYVRRQGPALVIIMTLVLISTGLDLLGPYMMGRAIDEFITTGDLPGLARLLLMMLGIYLTAALIVWGENYIAASMSQKVVRDLRNDLFDKLQSLPLRYLDQHAHGDLMSRLTNDVENVSMVLGSSATQLFGSLVTIVGVVVTMLLINLPLTLATLLTMPLSVFVTRWIARRTRQGFRDQQQHLGELNGIIEETVTGQRVVKAYVREEMVLADFDVANQKLRAAATKASILSGFMGPLMNMINNLSLAFVAAVGGLLAVNGLASVGNAVSFVNYARRFTRPINQLAQLFNSVQSALAGAERIFELLDEEPEIADAPNASAPKDIAGEVVFEDVCFSYEPGVPVLKHVSLHAKPGQTIALVGPTGAGKTTIVNLLTRFYEIDSGTIRIDGEDIRNIRKDVLRRKLALVLQDNFLFGDTVMANIRYGRLDATDEEVIEAARLANAHSFIERLPQGYQTVLTERASNLSQGQRQLLAIARAILADPDILILDEATSNVDTRTEKHLQDALLRLMQGRTSFVIAHR
ncbi:MAG: ABC transporter ATP-binding protein, partial [Chloroflexi bacterium]|nr:ABC transporter ATP-binding protein [Chloroflexota bacterium]